MASVLAAVLQGAVGPMVGTFAILLITAGFVLSYHRRHEKNILLKVGLAAGLFAAFGAFLNSVQGAATIDDTRAPLAALFLWVQVLHSFDVPRRRDLGFSVASSVALMALAGSLAFSTTFGFVVLLYAGGLMATLMLRHAAELRDKAGTEPAAEIPAEPTASTPVASDDRKRILRPVALLVALTLMASFVVFVAMPRLPGMQFAQLPIQILQRTPVSNIGQIANPGRDGLPSQSGGTGDGFAPDAYFGYGEELSLRVRGQLSEELAMRVRTPEPTLYRGQGFDTYVDGRWTMSDSEPVELDRGFDRAIDVPSPPGARGPSHEIVQTFYVERPLPNLVFHGGRAKEVYVPSTTLLQDHLGALQMPFLLEKDTIYSAVVDVPERPTPQETFFGVPGRRPSIDLEPYLQVPDSLGSRFRSLAEQITARPSTPAGKVEAVQDWLHRTKEYRLDIPPDPPNIDPVEVFVFDREEGFCEQIATTMAMMLRSVGIPTRLVTGFGPGERNLFSGYWEVRNADAHAWVEVYYPGWGWIPYDPTFGVPVSDAANTTFMLSPLARIASGLVPSGAVRRVTDAIAGATGPAIAVTLLAFAGAAVGFAWGRRRVRRPASTDPSGRVVDAWMRLEDELARSGCPRRPDETVREFAGRAATQPGVDAEALRVLVARFGVLRYGPHGATDADAEAVESLSAQVLDGMRREKPPAFAARR